MDSSNSVTQYIDGLKIGDEEAAQKIWERFLERMVRLADKKLKSSPRKSMDEEDVVQVAFSQFFQQVQQGRFSKLNDRDDLWQILAMLVDRRATDQIRRQNSQKAGGGRVHTESIFVAVDESAVRGGIAKIADMIPTPEMAAELTEIFRERIESLDGKDYRQVALLKMKGFTNPEIAAELSTSLRTVERRLEDIREEWSTNSN